MVTFGTQDKEERLRGLLVFGFAGFNPTPKKSSQSTRKQLAFEKRDRLLNPWAQKF
ncbi:MULTISPECIES: hypothetical protein [Desertifilum]|uniref:hypothetical protein n=1 Tax=unclassified Desertifilum TaxID=2621682 RepID=UPI00130185F2|nr:MULTISPECIES: hypothetical protein [Desertifilum]MBD2331016.1 hypothetical protein [Desertifilum sp. FACHB-868]